MSSWVLNVSKDRFLSISRKLPLVLTTLTMLPSFLRAFLRQLQISIRPSLHLLFSKPNKPSCVSLNSQDSYSSSVTVASAQLDSVSQCLSWSREPKPRNNPPDMVSWQLNGGQQLFPWTYCLQSC